MLFVAGGWLSATQEPRFTWLNAGLSIDYAPAAAAWAAAGAFGAGLLALMLRRMARLAAALASALTFVFALALLRYTVTVGDTSLSERGLLGTRTLSWQDVARVESGSRLVVVWGRADEQVRIDASTFAAEDRARLDRAISRRVGEAGRPGDARGQAR